MNLSELKSMCRVVAVSALLTACGSDDQSNGATFEVRVSNLTHAQPLSPVGIIAHTGDYRGWKIGEPATLALEELAEGENESFIALDDPAKLESISGVGLVMPGAEESIEISVNLDNETVQLTVATMLVNTNDAFAGTTGVDLSELSEGESIQLHLAVYDAGTERNDEVSSAIPGQGGVGFEAARNDLDKIARHPGVSGTDSAALDTPTMLNSTHRFDGPIARVVVTRVN